MIIENIDTPHSYGGKDKNKNINLSPKNNINTEKNTLLMVKSGIAKDLIEIAKDDEDLIKPLNPKNENIENKSISKEIFYLFFIVSNL